MDNIALNKKDGKIERRCPPLIIWFELKHLFPSSFMYFNITNIQTIMYLDMKSSVDILNVAISLSIANQCTLYDNNDYLS